MVNIVTSSDHRLGAQLCEDPRVDLVSFTGSTATGRAVMAAAAPTLKKVFLELGGKSAFIVLDDADLAVACARAAVAVSRHAGQGCAFTTRLVVPRDRYSDAVTETAHAMANIPVGDPADPATVCGPLISAKQRARVEQYLDLAVKEGGAFACGGGRPADLHPGYFIEPTVISGLTNDSPYGLSGTVFGADSTRLGWVVSRLRTGTINVNGGVWYSADTPFGGYKQSGIGREMGLAGFEEYLETKVVSEAVR